MSILDIKTATITEKGQIAIPKEIRKRFKIGSKVAIISFEDRIELRPLEIINEKIFTAIASEKSLSKEWNSKEDEEAWKNL
ncbi:MAG: AbrB/MazE/SpoVT family DNA-binding domain-containing protein [Candidatus Woesearchaeota archaeon]